jgi:hypothetical protein
MTTYLIGGNKLVNLTLLEDFERIGNELHLTMISSINPEKTEIKVFALKDDKEAEREYNDLKLAFKSHIEICNNGQTYS